MKRIQYHTRLVAMMAAALLVAGCSGSGGPTAPETGPTSPDAWRVEVFGGAYRAMAGTSPDALHAATTYFTQVYDGATWRAFGTGSTQNITAMWGVSAGDVFAALNGGAIIHFDGRGWHPSGTAPQTIMDIWGSSSKDVYAVGAAGTMMHFDGVQWSPVTTGVTWDMAHIWGSGPNDIYVLEFRYIGDKRRSSYIYYNGSAWQEGNADSNRGLLSVWGASAGHVYMTDNDGVLYFGTGGSFYILPGGHQYDKPLDEIAGLPSLGDVFVRDGDTHIQSVLGTGSDAHPVERVFGVWSAPFGRVYSLGAGGSIASTSGSAWSAMRGPINNANLSVVFGSAPDNVFALGNSDGVRLGANGFEHEPIPSVGHLNGGAALSPSFAVAVGYGGIIDMWDGSRWTQAQSPVNVVLYDVYAAGEDDVFAAGYQGVVVHFDGTSWTVQLPSALVSAFNCIDGTGGDDVFACGYGGGVYHYDGSNWTQMTTPTSEALNDVRALSPTDVYAVGDAGVVIHYDGTDWSDMPGPTAQNIRRVWAYDATHLYAMDDAPDIYRYDGSAWHPFTPLPTHLIADLWGAPDGRLFAAGAYSTVVSIDTR